MTVAESRIRRCAACIVIASNLRRGDAVVVRGGVHAMPLLEEISLACYRRGAVPLMLVTSDSYSKRMFEEIPASTLAQTPKHLLAMAKMSDMYIAIEEFDDPSIAEGFPRRKLEARQRAHLPLHELYSHPRKGKKWLYAGWPTKKAAEHYGIAYGEFEDMIVGGISIQPRELMRRGRRLSERMKDAVWVHVWDDKGTDFRVKVVGRRLNVDDGIISDEDYRVGDRGANLPAGELFVAPHEGAGSGTLYCPITRDRISDKPIKDVFLEFKDGRLMLDSTTASTNLDALKASFRQCLSVDRRRFHPIRTTHVAELGIGFNPRIRRAIGYILTDEKVSGTVHLAFGMNKSYGGTSDSTMHWDFVSAPGVNIEIEKRDGKRDLLMDKGRFV